MALEREIHRFEALKAELLQHHEGKFALVVGEDLIGVFDREEDAYKAGIEGRGNVPMLIKRILRVELTESVPAMTLGLLGARL